MQETSNNIQEDEIDLRELWGTIINRKGFIIAFTASITLLAIILALSITPIYEANAVLKIGNYTANTNTNTNTKILLTKSEELSNELNILYIDILDNIKDRERWIEEIKATKKQKSFIEIKSQAFNNEDAKDEIFKIFNFIDKRHSKILDSIKTDRKLQLIETKQLIDTVKLSIASLEKDKINVTKDATSQLTDNEIIYKSKLNKEYAKQISLISKISSKSKSKNATLKTLSRVSKNDLEYKIADNILSIIEIDKTSKDNANRMVMNINNQLNNLKINKLSSLYKKKREIEVLLEPLSFEKTKIVGQIITNDYPVKPKKKLIVVVAFVSGFILSIFIVFFMQFIRNEENEKPIKSNN